MARDILNTTVSILCSEAEYTASGLGQVESLWPWLRQVGVDPHETRDQLSALAARAREVLTDFDAAERRLKATRSLGRNAAERYLRQQPVMRRTLKAVQLLFPGPVAEAAAQHNTAWTLAVPRLQGAVAQTRRVLDDLRRADQALVSVEPGQRLLAEAQAWHTEFQGLFDERTQAELAYRHHAGPHAAVRAELQAALRSVSAAWATALSFSGNTEPALVFELAGAAAAQRGKRRSPRPKPDEWCADWEW